MNVSKNNATFPLPERLPPSRDFPAANRKLLEIWLAELPMGDPLRSAEQLLDLLHQINRTRLPDEDLIALVRQIEQRAGGALRVLQSKLRDVAVPAGRNTMALVELLALLHDELALAQRSIIDCRTGKKLFRKKDPAAAETALRASTRHLCENLKIHYLVKLRPPVHLWRHLYALFGFHRAGLRDSASDLNTDMDVRFKTAVLLHLCAPEALRGEELLQLCELLPELAPRARLLPPDAEVAPTLSATLPVREGAAPRLNYGGVSGDCDALDSCLQLDLHEVLREVRRRLVRLNERGGTGMEQATTLRVLHHLQNHFGSNRKRRAKRISDRHPVEVVAGLQQAHQWLSDPDGHPKDAPATAAAKPADPGLDPGSGNVRYDVVLNLEQVTIEAPGYFQSDPDLESSMKARLPLRHAMCQSDNFSTGGYGLTAEPVPGFYLRVGELLLLRDENSDRWLPAAVTWLSHDDAAVRFGAKLLAPHVRPGKALCHGKEDTRSAECLLLFKGGARPASIVLGPRCLPEKVQIAVDYGNHSLDMVLDKPLQRTQGYVEYACSDMHDRDLAPETVPLSHVTKPLPEGSPIGDSEFEDNDRPWRRFLR